MARPYTINRPSSDPRRDGFVPFGGWGVPRAGSDPSDSGGRTAARGRLFLGHITSPAPPSRKVRFYLHGSRVDIPRAKSSPVSSMAVPLVANPIAVRGKIDGFSDKARRRLLRFLSTLDTRAPVYTSCLTCPGDITGIEHSDVQRLFVVFKRRMQDRFPTVGAVWKLELQKRQAIHYHLILHGLENEGLRVRWHEWMVQTWCGLFASFLTPEDEKNHRSFHADPKNMIHLTGSAFEAYFAKYMGKDEDAEESPLKGMRFWGYINRAALVFSPVVEVDLTDSQLAAVRRLGGARRQKSANRGKHVAVSRIVEKSCALPELSENEFWALRSGFVPPVLCSLGLRSGRDPEQARFVLRKYQGAAFALGVRFGKAGKPFSRDGQIILTGKGVAPFVHALERFLGLQFSSVPAPVAPDPKRLPTLRAVAPGKQGDFRFRDVHSPPPRKPKRVQVIPEWEARAKGVPVSSVPWQAD